MLFAPCPNVPAISILLNMASTAWICGDFTYEVCLRYPSDASDLYIKSAAIAGSLISGWTSYLLAVHNHRALNRFFTLTCSISALSLLSRNVDFSKIWNAARISPLH